MAEKKGERLKLIMVFGLSVVLAVSVYFRFIHAKASTGTSPPTPVVLEQPMIVPQVQVKGDASQKEDRETSLLDPMAAPARDIFSPQIPPPPAKPVEVKLPEPEGNKPPPSFTLKGTISGGERSIAIIDGRFVRPGDRIGDYRVAWIGKKEVVLESEGKRITLEIMKNE